MRAKQATETPTSMASNEVKALQILTNAGCSSTPSLLAWKQDKQSRNMWVPGGHILYILMEKLPGFCPKCFYIELDWAERDELKEAWLYVLLPCSCR